MANQIALFGQTGLPVGIYASFHDQTNDLIQATGVEALHIKAQAEAYAQHRGSDGLFDYSDSAVKFFSKACHMLFRASECIWQRWEISFCINNRFVLSS